MKLIDQIIRKDYISLNKYIEFYARKSKHRIQKCLARGMPEMDLQSANAQGGVIFFKKVGQNLGRCD